MFVHVAFEIFRNRRWHRDEKSVFQFDLFFLRLDASKRRRRCNRRRREKQKRSDDEEERREERTTTQRASKKKHDDDEMGILRVVFVKKIASKKGPQNIYNGLDEQTEGGFSIIVRRFRYSQRFSPDPRFLRLPHDTAPNAFSLESKPERANGTTGRTVIRLCACLHTAPSDLEAPCTARASSRRIACRKIRRFLVDV